MLFFEFVCKYIRDISLCDYLFRNVGEGQFYKFTGVIDFKEGILILFIRIYRVIKI